MHPTQLLTSYSSFRVTCAARRLMQRPRTRLFPLCLFISNAFFSSLAKTRFWTSLALQCGTESYGGGRCMAKQFNN